jgi:hypothetical protein
VAISRDRVSWSDPVVRLSSAMTASDTQSSNEGAAITRSMVVASWLSVSGRLVGVPVTARFNFEYPSGEDLAGVGRVDFFGGGVPVWMSGVEIACHNPLVWKACDELQAFAAP